MGMSTASYWDTGGSRQGEGLGPETGWQALLGLGMLGRGTGICGERSCNWGILGEIWGMVLRGKGWEAGGLSGILGCQSGVWGVLGVLLEVWEKLAAKLGWGFHGMGRW